MTQQSAGQQPKVVVTHTLHREPYRRLSQECTVDMNPHPEPWSDAVIRRKLADADAVITFMTDRVNRDLVASCPRLRIVAGALKGADNLDVAACSAHGVWVSVVPDLLTVPTAELAIGLMIGLGRNLLAGDSHVRSGEFRGWRPHLYGTGIEGSTVGLLGFGAIGRAVALRLQGFGARLIYWDKQPAMAGEEAALGLEAVSIEILLKTSDFIVICLPLTPDTCHLLDGHRLACMKMGARLINPARGSVVVEADVADALRNGPLGGYAADVFEMEDWAREDRPQGIAPGLLAMKDKTLLTPHLGSAVHATRKAIEDEAVANVLDALQGKVPRGVINARARDTASAGQQ